MDMMAMGIESLEVAMNVGSTVVGSVDSLVQLAAQANEITCEISRCEWA